MVDKKYMFGISIILCVLLIGMVSAEQFNGRYNVEIPENIANNLVYDYEGYYFEVYLDGFEIAWNNGMKNSRGNAYGRELGTAQNSRVYKDILEDVDMELIVNDQEMKENIILHSKPFPDMNPVGEVDFKLRLDIDNRLKINTGGVYYKLSDDFTTDKPMHFYHEGVSRFSFPQPYAIDGNGTRLNLSYKYESTSFLGVFFKRSYLSVVVPREYLVDAVYPVVIDPTAVAGCSTTSTEVQCWNGIFYGNNLATTLNVSIINATLDGISEHEMDIDAGGYIYIWNSSLYGYGTTVPEHGNVHLDAGTWINITDTYMKGNGATDNHLYGSGITGGTGDCHVYAGTGYDVSIYGLRTDCYGGWGGVHSNNALNTCGNGGAGSFYIRGENLYVYQNPIAGGHNNDLRGYGGTVRYNCDTYCGCSGGNGILSIDFTNVFIDDATYLSTQSYGQVGGSKVAPANGGNGRLVLNAEFLEGLFYGSYSGGNALNGGTYGTSTLSMNSNANAIFKFKSNSNFVGYADTSRNSTVNILAKELTFEDSASLKMSGYKSGNYINLNSSEPSRFGLFDTANITNNIANGYIDVIAEQGAGQYLILGEHTDPQLDLSGVTIPIQYRTTIEDYYAPYVNLSSPSDGEFLSDTNVSFVCGAEAYDGTVTSVELYHDGSGTFQSEGTVATSGVVVEAQFYDTFSTGTYTWSCFATDSLGNSSIAGINRTLILDVDDPVVSIYTPTGEYDYAKPNQTNLLYLTYDVTDANLDNSTCVYEYPTGVWNNFTCYDAPNISLDVIGNDDTSLTLCANDTAGNQGCDSISWSYYIWENSHSFNSQATEVSTQDFVLNVSLTNTTVAFAKLYYNNTPYTASIDLRPTGNAILSREIVVPNVDTPTNFTFFWNIQLNSPEVNTTEEQQEVLSINIDNCSNFTELIMNFTLQGEVTQVPIYGNTSIEVDVTLFTPEGNLILQHSEEYEDTPYAPICINEILNETYYIVDAVVSYIAEDYVQEFWFLDDGELYLNESSLNAYTTKTPILMDLLLVDSTTFLFKYFDETYIIHPNAVVTVLREYISEGVFKEVERCRLDNNGQCHLHLVEEDVIYQFRITDGGELEHLSGEYNAKCQTLPCQIILQKGAVSGDWETEFDGLEVGTYDVVTDKTNRTVTLDFSLEETGTMDLEVYEYDPELAQDVLVATDTVVAQTGSAQVFVPLSYGNKTYYAVVRHNDEFVTSRWVDMQESGYPYFGTLGLFLGALLVLTLGLIAVSSGGWTIAFIIVGLVVASITKLIDMDLYLIMFVVSAGGLIIWKLATRRSI